MYGIGGTKNDHYMYATFYLRRTLGSILSGSTWRLLAALAGGDRKTRPY